LNKNLQRASREASKVLLQSKIQTVPVPVEKVAARWAHVLKQRLDADISGMLVPLSNVATEKRWAIIVNSIHPRVRQRFTIAHELGHLLLHGYTTAHADRNFKIRLRDTQSSEGSVLEEIEANRFAAELLMPEPLVRSRLAEHAMEYTPVDKSSERELTRMAKEFDVSTQAVSIRISTLLG
jgi:Zn-dependent peptidase ImmA (M78 family)